MKEDDIKVGMVVKVKSKTTPGYFGVVDDPFSGKIEFISMYKNILHHSHFNLEKANKKIFTINGNFYIFEDFNFSKQLMLFEDD